MDEMNYVHKCHKIISKQCINYFVCLFKQSAIKFGHSPQPKSEKAILTCLLRGLTAHLHWLRLPDFKSFITGLVFILVEGGIVCHSNGLSDWKQHNTFHTHTEYRLMAFETKLAAYSMSCLCIAWYKRLRPNHAY